MATILAILKWTAMVLGTLFFAGVLWYLFIFDWNDIRDHLAAAVGERTAREFSIEGDVDVELGWVPRVHLERVRLENADWSEHADMVQVEALEFTIVLLELLRGRVVLPELVLQRPRLLLERNQAGEPNWDLVTEPPAEVAVPEARGEFPIIGRLLISEGALVYDDRMRGIDLEGTVTTAVGVHEPDREQVHLEGAGSFEGQPFTLDAWGGSLLMLREEDDPYPVQIEAQVGETRIHVEGTLIEPLQALGLDLHLELEGRDLAELFPIFGIPFPPTRPYQLAGRLSRHEQSWRFTDFAGVVGASDLAGDLNVDLGQEPPSMRADFVSQRLELSELGGFLGVRPPELVEPKERLIPDSPVNLERLRAMNIDLTFDGEQVVAARLPTGTLRYRLVLENGRMDFDPLTYDIAGGRISGAVHLDGSQDAPALSTDLELSRLHLEHLFAEQEVLDIEGILGGHMELNGTGHSLGEILGTSQGSLHMAMSGGAVDRFVVAAIGLDIAQMLALLGTEESPMPLRCSVAALQVEGGVAQAELLVIDAETSTISGEGKIELDTERLDLRLQSHPKEPSPLVLGGEIQVSGTFLGPEFSIDLTELLTRAGAAAVLGVLLGPLAAILPFIEPGLGEDTACDELFAQAREAAGQSMDR